MVARNSSSSYKLWNFISVFYRHRILCATQANYSNLLSSKFCYSRDTNQGLRFFSSSAAGSFQKGKDETSSKVPSLVPSPPPNYSLFSWVKGLMGSLLSLLLLIPFSWNQKLETLPGLQGKVVKVVEEGEQVVEVVEKIATMTEKASAVVVENFPDKCKFKQAALVVEHVSNVIIDDAEQTKNVMNKVNDLAQDITALEAILEPVIIKVVEMGTKKN